MERQAKWRRLQKLYRLLGMSATTVIPSDLDAALARREAEWARRQEFERQRLEKLRAETVDEVKVDLDIGKPVDTAHTTRGGRRIVRKGELFGG